ncbi:Sensory/regulatory protein RpfC [Thiorhodovibrio winogradskyi]|uniref:histidine kinase n=1 Tax=Thiorhodovibrio winogradskyi TaxID=77007 RepID=A0ABZ0S554_9GAMM|nr:ATP-binding protein [Thiorhodovibrio winogradskyi]
MPHPPQQSSTRSPKRFPNQSANQSPSTAKLTSSPAPKPVLRRLLPPLALLLACLLAGAIWLPIDLHRRYLDASLENLAVDVIHELELSLREQADGLAIAGQVLARDANLQEALAAFDRPAALAQWGPLFASLKQRHQVTHFYLLGPDRLCLLRLHQPNRHSDVIARFTAREAERRGQSVAGIELGPLGSFTLRVVVPVHADGRLLGYVELGKEIEDVLNDLRYHLNVEIALLIDKIHLNREGWREGMHMLGRTADWDQFARQAPNFVSNPELLDRLTAPALEQADTQLPPVSKAPVTKGVRFQDQERGTWWSTRLPLRDATEARVGDLLVFRDISAEEARFYRLLGISLLIGLALLLMVVGLVILLLRRVDDQLLAQQRALHDSDQLLRDLARMVPGFLFQMEQLSDGRLAIPFASDGIRDIYALSPDDVRADAQPILTPIHPKDREAFLASIQASAKDLSLWQLDFRVLMRGKGLRWLRGLSRPEQLADGRVRWSGYITDISASKADEERLSVTNRQLAQAISRAEAANHAKSQFLANTSHEIRTPLNGVLGTLQLLGERDLDKDQRQLLETGLECGRTLLQLINDILDFSKINAGAFELRPSTFAPRELLHTICAVFALQAKPKNLRVEYSVSATVPVLVRTDAGRLRQILLNLIGNAVKFTDQGRIDIDLQAEPVAKTADSCQLVYTITDTGIGMDPAIIDRLFEPFTQADASDTRRHKGTGLGLSIVKRLLDRLGGDIQIDTKPNAGCRIRFTLPVGIIRPTSDMASSIARVSETTAATTDLNRPVTPRNNNLSLSILIAEDEPANRLVVDRLLTKVGHRATCVENGQQALDALAAGHFDLILMDVQMPELDGLEATRRIRTDPRATWPRDIPIIALTAHAMAQDADRFIAAGMTDFLPKPIDFAALKKLLARYTDR